MHQGSPAQSVSDEVSVKALAAAQASAILRFMHEVRDVAEEKVLDIAQGAKEMSGAPVVLVKLPCCEGNEATSCVSCVLVHA